MTAHKYGNDVDTDVIIPARYLNTSAPEELAAHCMEDIDPMFAGHVRHGDIIVAGKNFGCGSSREQAPTRSTSAFPFWNAPPPQTPYPQGMRYRSTLKREKSPTSPRAGRFTQSRSRRS